MHRAHRSRPAPGADRRHDPGGRRGAGDQLDAGRSGPRSPICSATRSSAAAPTSTRCSTRRPRTTAEPAQVPLARRFRPARRPERDGRRRPRSPVRLLVAAVGRSQPPIGWRSCRTTSPTPPRWWPSTTAAIASAPMVGFGTPIKTLSFYDVYRDQTPARAGHRRLLRHLDGAAAARRRPPPRSALFAVDRDRRRASRGAGGGVGEASSSRARRSCRRHPLDHAGRGAARGTRAGLRAGSIDRRGRHLQPLPSPQRFAFELTFGPYRPDIDGEFDGARHAVQGLLRLRPEPPDAASSSTTSSGTATARSRPASASATSRSRGTAPIANGTGAAERRQSQLKVVPVSLSAVYRFDYFLQERGFPLVPFGKLGLDWAYWQNTDGNGNIADATAAADAGAAGRWGGTWPAASRWCSTSSIRTPRTTSIRTSA